MPRILPAAAVVVAMVLAEAAKTVCVVGAGAGGLVASKVMRAEGMAVSVFEQTREVGGIWRKSGDVIYEGLWCNLPHQIMAYRGVPFEASRSFVSATEVGAYLERYAVGVDVALETSVKSVARAGQGWLVKTWSEQQGEVERLFDFVVVANGHYDKPASLALDGDEIFPGEISHSRDYWNPDRFAGRTVVCVGARSSGTDVAKELVFDGSARRVVVADKAATDRLDFFGGKLAHAPAIRRLLGDGGVEFVDGSLEPDVAHVVLCHGYDYSFPFLDETLVEVADRSVSPLYLHMFHVDYPSLVFLGIPHSVVPFPLMEIQAMLAARVFAGRAALPALAERRSSLEAHARSLRREKDMHHLGDRQWPYSHRLLDLANLDDDDDAASWRTFVDTNRAVYEHVGPRRPPVPGFPDDYRRLEYEVDHATGRWACLNERDVDDARAASERRALRVPEDDEL